MPYVKRNYVLWEFYMCDQDYKFSRIFGKHAPYLYKPERNTITISNTNTHDPLRTIDGSSGFVCSALCEITNIHMCHVRLP